MRRKYNTTQKNMKQISIESLRVNIGNSLDKNSLLHFIAPCKIATTQILKYLITKVYKHLDIQTLHTCTHYTL
jgi:hypothetical protein